MAKSSITIKIKVKWWLKLYLYGLTAVCYLTNNEPAPNKVNAWITRGIEFEKIPNTHTST